MDTNISDAERVETIILTRSTGRMGAFHLIENEGQYRHWSYRVELFDPVTGESRMNYLVRRDPKAWVVSAFGVSFQGATLLDAALKAVAFADMQRKASMGLATIFLENS